jgi:hypothetical protein
MPCSQSCSQTQSSSGSTDGTSVLAADLPAQFGVLPEDVPPIVESMPSPQANPAEWWLLEHCYNELIGDMGGFDELPPWPALPAERGPPLARS